MEWTSRDVEELKKRGISPEEADAQVRRLREGTSPTPVYEPCTPGRGIVELDDYDTDRLAEVFIEQKSRIEVVKFVPASGAASRMFKHVYEADPENPLFQTFVDQIHDFAFYPALQDAARRKGTRVEQLIEHHEWQKLSQLILGAEGLHFGNKPKGEIPFHAYPNEARTAFAEHLYEAVHYGGGSGGANLHFTIPGHYSEEDVEWLAAKAADVTADTKMKVNLSYSHQFPSTDTLSIDQNEQVVRNEDESLLFRPGGHGSLIDNLDRIEANIIFVKNIDNVVPESKMAPTVRYKKALAGLAVMLHRQRSEWMQALRERREWAEDKAASFFREWFAHPDEHLAPSAEDLLQWLDRPLRVCGMVRNEGEPGGGPFWVKNQRGLLSAQIVERSQIDESDPQQSKALQASTHFNPVDLVCITNRPDAGMYKLHDYMNPERAFIAEKSHEGRPIKVLEHPGLWNGAMEDWLTVFVEVPMETFAPVKTVNDLLRSAHRP